MKVAQTKVKIISNRKFSSNYGYLEFESSQIAKSAVAGQFVNIRVADTVEPLLRRPISIHGVKAAKVKIIYEIIGKGTQILATRRAGEFLEVIGPLGQGFKYSPLSKKTAGIKNILIAGGMGVAPLVFLAEKLKITQPLVLIGARSREKIICAQEFKALGCSVKLATDDGSVGFKGTVTDLLRTVLKKDKSAALFSCGPHPMLKAVAKIAQENKIPTQLSLEEHMACGIGACLGCVVATKAGYKSVCKDGPVFPSEELIW